MISPNKKKEEEAITHLCYLTAAVAAFVVVDHYHLWTCDPYSEYYPNF
jgi:hypothetical protein